MELIDREGTVIGGLTVTPHPLTLDGQRTIQGDLVPGETLDTFLRRHVDTIDSGIWIVTLGGQEVPPAMWRKVKPKPGAIIECRAVVQRDALRLIAVVVLAIYAPQIAGAMGFTAGTAAYSLATAAIVTAGSLVINKVLGPKMAGGLSDNKASPTYQIGGGRNRARAFEPIGLLFGEVQVTPDYASLPYTWFEGEDQYLYAIFHGGINCGSVSNVSIGQTPIANYQEVTTWVSGFTEMLDQPFVGWGNVDAIAGAKLDGYMVAEDLDNKVPLSPGPWVTRTTSSNTIALQADIEGSVFKIKDNGAFLADYGAYIVGEYRPLPDGAWQPWVSEYILSPSTRPVRRTYGAYVAAGQYEVRFRKDTVDVNGTSESNALTWSQLKSIQPDTGDYGGMGRMGIRIKASGQLSGTLDEVKWLAAAQAMPYWNGSAWVTATNRANGLSNPGAQFLRFARGIYDPSGRLIAGLGLSDSQIDGESLKGFMMHCAAKSFTFDHWFDSPVSCDEVLDAIAAVGMGSKTWQSGKLGVVWAAENQPIEGVVNMATMKAKTFRVNYQTAETADGIEYAYFDRERGFQWKTLRVQDPSAAAMLNPARITSVGVTTEAHAAILARFHLAQNIFQRKDIGYDTDLEHLTYKRMSVMALSHDVTQWGYGGRLQSVVNNSGILTLTLDDVVPAGSAPRYIGLRIPGETGYRAFGVAAFSGESREVTLTSAWPSGVPVPGTLGNPAHDTIWIYDFKAMPGYKVRVAAIQPQANMKGATVSVVPESAEFWDYVLNGTYAPPASQSLLPLSPPTVSGLVITEELQRQGNAYHVELTATFDVSGRYDHAQVWGATQGGAIQKIGDTRSRRFSWRGGVDDVWTIEVRAFDSLGRSGSYAGSTYAVAGLRVPPANIANLSISGSVLSFSHVNNIDLAGYRLKFHYGNNQDWGSAAPLHEGLITESPFDLVARPAGTVTIMGKAVDTSGNESEAAAVIITDLGDPVVANVVETIDFGALGWPSSEAIGRLDPGIHDYIASDISAFTRSTTATYTDADGVLRVAAIDAPRFDYDPVTHELRGLLIEEASTNLVPNAADPAVSNINKVTPGSVLNPAGAPAVLFKPSTSNTTHTLSSTGIPISSLAAGDSLVFTQSILVRPTGADDIRIYFVATHTDNGVQSYRLRLFDPATRTFIAHNTAPAFSNVITDVEEWLDGWLRVSVTTTFTKGANSTALSGSYQLWRGTAQSYAGNGSEGVYLYGSQLETLPYMSSLILTGGSAASRAADMCATHGVSGGSIIGGALVANDLDSAYGTDEQSFYGPDNDPAFDLSTYARMVYATSEVQISSALAGSMMTLDIEYQGIDLAIEYRLVGPGPAYGVDADSAYGDDDEPFFDAPGPWIPWPGQIVAANDIYQFRVTIGAGPTEGRITALSIVIDAPDIVEYLEDVVISSAGTIIPYASNFRVIKHVTATLQANVSSAITIETNKTVNLQPVLRAYNASHTAVGGATADIILKGY